MIGLTLSIVIPVVVLGYGVWLAVKLLRDRKKGGGGCAGCPYAGGCRCVKDCKLSKEGQTRRGN